MHSLGLKWPKLAQAVHEKCFLIRILIPLVRLLAKTRLSTSGKMVTLLFYCRHSFMKALVVQTDISLPQKCEVQLCGDPSAGSE